MMRSESNETILISLVVINHVFSCSLSTLAEHEVEHKAGIVSQNVQKQAVCVIDGDNDDLLLDDCALKLSRHAVYTSAVRVYSTFS
jgi:hypothetical protein